MKIIELGRGRGKTTRLISWLVQGSPLLSADCWDRALLVSDLQRAELVREGVRVRLGLPETDPPLDINTFEIQGRRWANFLMIIGHVLTPDVVRSGRWRPDPRVRLAIDELDDVLCLLLGAHVELATLTPDHQ